MEMCYNSELVMPNNYVVINEEEMTYVDGGWDLKWNVTKTWGIPTGVNVTLTATVSECAWIVAAGAAFAGVCGAAGLAVPVVGPIIATKGFIIGSAFVAFAATIVATHDKACSTKFSCTKHIGL